MTLARTFSGRRKKERSPGELQPDSALSQTGFAKVKHLRPFHMVEGITTLPDLQELGGSRNSRSAKKRYDLQCKDRFLASEATRA